MGRRENLLEERKAFWRKSRPPWRNAILFGGVKAPLEEADKSLEVGVEAGYINISAAPAILCIIRMSDRQVRIQMCKTQFDMFNLRKFIRAKFRGFQLLQCFYQL